MKLLQELNNKQRERLNMYIRSIFDPEGYEECEGYVSADATFSSICNFIYNTFKNEMRYGALGRRQERDIFEDWCRGLPSIIDTCYYYNRSAAEDYKEIMEYKKGAKISDPTAEKYITYLIFQTLKSEINKLKIVKGA